jgi:hypothetical protein
LARRLTGTGVTANCLHPGFVRTALGRDVTGVIGTAVRRVLPFQPGPATGADTSVYLASSPAVADVTGGYFVKCKPTQPSALARDEGAAARLWTHSEQLAGPDPAGNRPLRALNTVGTASGSTDLRNTAPPEPLRGAAGGITIALEHLQDPRRGHAPRDVGALAVTRVVEQREQLGPPIRAGGSSLPEATMPRHRRHLRCTRTGRPARDARSRRHASRLVVTTQDWPTHAATKPRVNNPALVRLTGAHRKRARACAAQSAA